MRSDNQKQYTKKPIKIRYGHRPLFSILILSISFLIINLTSNGFHLQLIESVQAEVEPEDLGSGPGRFNSIYAGDIDDDGRAEIVFGNYDGYVTVLEYRRGEFFTEWQSPKTGHRVWGVTVADFYGDSTKEIIIGNGDGDIYAYDAKSHKEVWHTASFGNSELVRDIHGLLVHDLGSNDTRYLLAGTGYKTDQDLGTVFIFGVSDNDTEKVRPIAKIADIDNRLRGIAVGDVDGDGALEIVFGSGVATGENPGKGYVRIYDVKTVLANKDGHPKSEWTSKNLKGDCVAIELADFTGDDIP